MGLGKGKPHLIHLIFLTLAVMSIENCTCYCTQGRIEAKLDLML